MTAIRDWLEGLGLGQYVAIFEAAEITPALCGSLTDADLERLGVTVLGHRRLIGQHAQRARPPSRLAGMDRPSWVDEAPTLLAVSLDEYFREEEPLLFLWHACDIAELTLRFAAIAGLSELRAGGTGEGAALDARLLQELRQRIELPTLGKWQGVTQAVLERLGPDSAVAGLARLLRETLFPLLDGRPGDGPEGSLRQLRNQLAHGGGLSKAHARRLVTQWVARLDGFVAGLEVTSRLRLVVRTPQGLGMLVGPSPVARPWAAPDTSPLEQVRRAFRSDLDIVLVSGARSFGLWPLSLYGVPLADGRVGHAVPSPQVYVRRGDVGLVFTPIGSEGASQHTEGDESLREFERLLGEEGPAVPREQAFTVGGFEVQLARESQQLVGRLEELLAIDQWVGNDGARFGAVLGGAGTGKSVLMARVATDLADGAKAGGRTLLAYRFKGGDDRCNRESFLAFVAERLGPPLGRPHEGGVPALTLVAGLVRETPRLLFVVDGLDEIAEQDATFIDEVLRPLVASGARVLCAGRPETWVQGPLERAGAARLFPQGLPLMSEGDIRTMILEKTGPLRRLFIERDEDRGTGVRNEAIERITRAAGGLPLYVNYVIGDLLSRRLTLEALGDLPPTLAAYHERLLQRGQLGDLGLVNTPLLVALCVAQEPLTVPDVTAVLVAWGVLSADDEPGRLVERSLRALETVVRRVPDSSGQLGFSPYHHSLRQHVLSSPDTRHAVSRARRTFRDLSVAAGEGRAPGTLAPYLQRQGAQHLSADGTPAQALAFVASMRARSGPIERRRNLGALNALLERDDSGAFDPGVLFSILVELHDGAEIAPGARAIYRHHRPFLTSPAAAPLQLGFGITYELAAEIAHLERNQGNAAAVDLMRSWSVDHACPAQYSACYALNYLFMREPGRVPPGVWQALARSNPYDRMVVLNALMFRALEGASPFQWVAEGPFWRSRWPYLSRDAELVRACHAFASVSAGTDGPEVEIRHHLETVDTLARDLAGRTAVRADEQVAALVASHWTAVADLRSLRHLRARLVVNREWMDLGRLLLANPFWQMAGIGAEVLAERHRTSPPDRPAIDALLHGFEPFPGAGLLGDRDLGMADLARLTLLDDTDSVAVAGRLGPFLTSPSSHQRAEAALHLTQLLGAMPDPDAQVLLDRLAPFLERAADEADVWALQELVQLDGAVASRGLKGPAGLDLERSPLLHGVPGWRELPYNRFADTFDRAWETAGVRSAPENP